MRSSTGVGQTFTTSTPCLGSNTCDQVVPSKSERLCPRGACWAFPSLTGCQSQGPADGPPLTPSRPGPVPPAVLMLSAQLPITLMPGHNRIHLSCPLSGLCRGLPVPSIGHCLCTSMVSECANWRRCKCHGQVFTCNEHGWGA
jgi:hypothetical protein